jgi:hypothetical protein
MIFTRSPRLPRLDPETRGVRSEAGDGAGCPFSLNRGEARGWASGVMPEPAQNNAQHKNASTGFLRAAEHG